MLFDILNHDNEKFINFLFLRFLIFFRDSWVGAHPALKNRLGGRRPPSISPLQMHFKKIREKEMHLKQKRCLCFCDSNFNTYKCVSK